MPKQKNEARAQSQKVHQSIINEIERLCPGVRNLKAKQHFRTGRVIILAKTPSKQRIKIIGNHINGMVRFVMFYQMLTQSAAA